MVFTAKWLQNIVYRKPEHDNSRIIEITLTKPYILHIRQHGVAKIGGGAGWEATTCNDFFLDLRDEGLSLKLTEPS